MKDRNNEHNRDVFDSFFFSLCIDYDVVTVDVVFRSDVGAARRRRQRLSIDERRLVAGGPRLQGANLMRRLHRRRSVSDQIAASDTNFNRETWRVFTSDNLERALAA